MTIKHLFLVMPRIVFFLIITIGAYGFSQETSTSEDLKYREDQFYVSITYNLLGNKPDVVSQQGFSTGLHFGFIRDMPINPKRTLGFGLGLGFSINTYNQNLRVSRDSENNTVFTVIDDNQTSFTKNKYFTYLVEAPFEFRWRNSTTTNYKFWRVYSGFKLGYVFAHKTKYIGEPKDEQYTDIDNFNNVQYGLTLSAGYNTWNLYIYYALNPIFDNTSKVNDKSVDFKTIKIGLIFYIL
jgi:hypothetical protein